MARLWLMPPLMRLPWVFALAVGVSVAGLSASCVQETTPNPVDAGGTLAPPPVGQGVQITSPAFAIPAGTEIQNCYFFKVSDLLTQAGLSPTATLNLHRLQVSQKIGSHHMNLFRVRTVVPGGLDPTQGPSLGTNGTGPCFKSSNWADWPLLANMQQGGELDWTFPDGVANELDPSEWLMLQTHYVNASTQKTPDGVGEVAVNMWHMPIADVQQEMGTLFATNQNIRVCQSNPNPTYQASCHIKSATPVHVIGANGHFHSRGKTFDIFSWDGTSTATPPASDMFYQSTTWAEPPMAHSPDLDTDLPANGGIVYSCEFQWVMPDPSIGCAGLNAYDAMKYNTPASAQDCCYTFGPIVEKNEHCNAFVYYYPKADDVACF
jgi:hypothetical protein